MTSTKSCWPIGKSGRPVKDKGGWRAGNMDEMTGETVGRSPNARFTCQPVLPDKKIRPLRWPALDYWKQSQFGCRLGTEQFQPHVVCVGGPQRRGDPWVAF